MRNCFIIVWIVINTLSVLAGDSYMVKTGRDDHKSTKEKGYFQVKTTLHHSALIHSMPKHEAPVVGELPYNARYIELQQCQKNPAGEVWCQLGYPYSLHARYWVLREALQRDDGKSHRAKGARGLLYAATAQHSTDLISVYSGQAKTYPVINVLRDGQTGIEAQVCQDGWCWIEFRDANHYRTSGWIHRKSLTVDGNLSFVFENNASMSLSRPFVNLNHDEGPNLLYLSDDDYITSGGGSVKVWDVKTDRLLAHYRREDFYDTRAEIFKPGEHFVYDDMLFKITDKESNIWLEGYDSKGTYRYRIKMTSMFNSFRLKLSPTKMYITRGYINDPIEIYDRHTGELMNTIAVNDPDIYGEVRSEGDPGIRGGIGWEEYAMVDHYLYTASDDATMVWDMTSGKKITNLSPCGRLLSASSSYLSADFCKFKYSQDNQIKIYDRRSQHIQSRVGRCKRPEKETLTQLELSGGYLVQTCYDETDRGDLAHTRITNLGTNRLVFSQRSPQEALKPVRIWKSKRLTIDKISRFDGDEEENDHAIFSIHDLSANTPGIYGKINLSHVRIDRVVFGRRCMLFQLEGGDGWDEAYYRWNSKKIWEVDSCKWDDLYENKYTLRYLHRNVMELYDLSQQKTAVTFYYFGLHDWLTMTPEGYYVGSEGASQYLNITQHTPQGMKACDFEKYQKIFFRPDLVRLKLSGDEEVYQKEIAVAARSRHVHRAPCE